MVLFMDDVSGLPDASLSAWPIIVASPMSCMASEVGVPVRVRFSPSSFEKERHSGPSSSTRSVATNPHVLQNISPVLPSVSIAPFAQRGQRSLFRAVCVIRCNPFFKSTYKYLSTLIYNDPLKSDFLGYFVPRVETEVRIMGSDRVTKASSHFLQFEHFLCTKNHSHTFFSKLENIFSNISQNNFFVKLF